MVARPEPVQPVDDEVVTLLVESPPGGCLPLGHRSRRFDFSRDLVPLLSNPAAAPVRVYVVAELVQMGYFDDSLVDVGGGVWRLGDWDTLSERNDHEASSQGDHGGVLYVFVPEPAFMLLLGEALGQLDVAARVSYEVGALSPSAIWPASSAAWIRNCVVANGEAVLAPLANGAALVAEGSLVMDVEVCRRMGAMALGGSRARLSHGQRRGEPSRH